MSALVTRTNGFEDAASTFLARVVGEDAALLLIANVTSISYKVYDTTDGSESATGSLTVSSVIFDTLQTDARWTVDTTGYNFKFLMPASAFPAGDRLYRVEFLFTVTGSIPAFVVFDHYVKAVRTS